MSKLHRIQRQSNAAFRNQPIIPLHPGPADSSEYVWVKKTQPKPRNGINAARNAVVAFF